jgi:L-lactate dehydrogenase complex protein LldE
MFCRSALSADGFNMVKVLEKTGCTVTYNTKQTCCGQPAFNAGFWDEARTVCIKFVKDFSGSDYIVTQVQAVQVL